MPMSTITVAGIDPGLNILGATQQFNYTQPLSTFQITNSFAPIIGVPSQFNQEYRNNLLSGFRLTHLTTNTDTYGSLTLQNFVNAQSTGSNMIKFDNSGISIFATLNMNSNAITNSTWNGNTITVPYGGTGLASTAAYSVICGGTTSTGALQSVASLGTTGQVLTSQGASALPIWTTNGSGTVTSITAGVGLSGGTITTSGTIDITDTAVTPGTYNGNFTVNSRGQLTAANNELKGVLASLYMSGNMSTATSVTVADTFTKILGTTVSGTLVSFTMPTDNKLQYTGTDPITTMVSVDLSVSPTVSSTLAIMIYKNGSAIQAANYNYQVTAGKPISLSVRTDVSFVTTDFVEAFITSDNIDNVTVSYMNLSVVI